MHLRALSALLACALLASGCASFGRGLGEALVGNEREDTRECHVRGPAFPGMESFMRVQEEAARNEEPNRVLKILMVHGIGGLHVLGVNNAGWTLVFLNLAQICTTGLGVGVGVGLRCKWKCCFCWCCCWWQCC